MIEGELVQHEDGTESEQQAKGEFRQWRRKGSQKNDQGQETVSSIDVAVQAKTALAERGLK